MLKLIPLETMRKLYSKYGLVLNFQCTDCGLCMWMAEEHLCNKIAPVAEYELKIKLPILKTESL